MRVAAAIWAAVSGAFRVIGAMRLSCPVCSEQSPASADERKIPLRFSLARSAFALSDGRIDVDDEVKVVAGVLHESHAQHVNPLLGLTTRQVEVQVPASLTLP
jgi:hypothetical protein